MIETLLVSKPITPPWNDSGKNLVRDLARHCDTVRHRVLTVEGFSLGLDHVTEEPIYGATGAFSPSFAQNLRVLGRLLLPDRQRVYHFFFAPNPRTSSVASWSSRLKRRASVQTVMSVPAQFEGVERLLFADRIVALSEHTAELLRSAGVNRVVHIPPGIDPPPAYGEAEVAGLREEFGFPADRPTVVFPGDYEFSEAATTFAGAIERLAPHVDATFVYACRIKRPASREIQAAVRARLAPFEQQGRVQFLGETRRIRELLAAADVVVLPSESTYAKMDIPLVLLEALAEGTPIVVADIAPLREVLGTADCRPESPVGRVVAPLDPGALADTLGELLTDHETRRALGGAGRSWVEQRFHARAMGAAHGALYQSLAS